MQCPLNGRVYCNLQSVAGCLLSGQSALERPESIVVVAAARRHIILGLVMPIVIIPRVRRIVVVHYCMFNMYVISLYCWLVRRRKIIAE